MKLPYILLIICAAVFLTGCESGNQFVGQWRVTVQCLNYDRDSGHASMGPRHLEGTYDIARNGENFVLSPTSGSFKDEFSTCELKYNPLAGNIADGSDFDCDSFDPGPGAMNLSGTCDLTHSGSPAPHSVQVFLLRNSPLYDGQTNPVVTFTHSGPGHAGWLH